MAKDNRSIAVQVAELTPQQRKNILRIALYDVLISVLTLAVMAFLVLIPAYKAVRGYVEATEDYGDAVDEWIDYGDELEQIIGGKYLYDAGYQALGVEVDEAREKMDEANELSQEKLNTAGIALGVYVVMYAIMLFYICKKHPYYSFRKHYYILFHRKCWQ